MQLHEPLCLSSKWGRTIGTVPSGVKRTQEIAYHYHQQLRFCIISMG